MSSYKRAVRGLSAPEREAIEKSLAAWGTETRLGRIIVSNLNPHERFLPAKPMRALLLAVSKHHGAGFWELASAYEEKCHQHTLKGGEVRNLPRSLLVGRAVEQNAFKNYLKRHCRHFSSWKQIDDFLQRLLIGAALTAEEKHTFLSLHGSWVTWDARDSTDPFAFAEPSRSAQYIRACLGLDPEKRCKDGLLLLSYRLEDGCSLFRPTVADADIHLFFQPPPSGCEDHGQTRPWLSGTLSKRFPVPQPRPEGVHERQPMRTLSKVTRVT